MSPRTILAFMTLPLLPSACAAASGLGEQSDGGPAAYAAEPSARDTLVPADIAGRFPVAQRARLHVLGGGVRGFGMLAEFGDGGPGRLVVARNTTVSGGEPYTPVALARVFDPSGRLVAIENFTAQNRPVDCRVITLPPGGPAGIWRVSFSGGRGGDSVEIRLPRTDIWGVRGELSLGYDRGSLRDAWLWVPPSSRKLLLGIESGRADGVRLLEQTGTADLAAIEADPAGRVGRIVVELEKAPKRPEFARLRVPATFSGALVIDGAPGLLCPTRAAAERLKGGTVRSHDLLTAGPLQARARNWMVARAKEIRKDHVPELPATTPEGLENPRYHALLFGKYSLLNNLSWLVARQNETLDPASPHLGGDRPFFNVQQDQKPSEDSWANFLPGRLPTAFFPSSFAVAATFDSPLNPAKDDPQMVLRAALGALADIVALSGDDLMREGTLFDTRYPVTHAFFAYPDALAQPFLLLKDRLDPEAREIWREGLIAVGDKLADYQAYQSNQWAHMMHGHLLTYEATGERRFLRYFERQMTAFLDGAYGKNAKFGQHLAGYFLEEFGPDGNYDKLNSYAVAASWLAYRDLPEADPVLVQKLRRSLELNMRFNALFWMPEPDGAIVGPDAINCRTNWPLAPTGYPGSYLCSADIPLAASRQLMRAQPASGIGAAMTMPFDANSDAWAREVIAEGLRRGTGAWQTGGGAWLPALARVATRPYASPAPLPALEKEGAWNLPGIHAWKHDGLYGVVLADVDGADRRLNARLGGAPGVLWTKSAGTFLASMHAGKPQKSDHVGLPEEITFACVYRETGDTIFCTGKERSVVTAGSNGSAVVESAKALPDGGLSWRYQPVPGGVRIRVNTTGGASAEGLRLNLPLLLRLDDATANLVDDHTLVYRASAGEVRISWDAALKGELLPSVHPQTRRLVVPLNADGSLEILITSHEP